MHSQLSLFTLGATLLVGGLATAQGNINPQVRGGIFSGAALALSLEGGPGSPGSDPLRIAPPLAQTYLPPAFDPNTYQATPDHSVATVFPQHADIELDALSTGNDLIGPLRANGGLDLANQARWQAVSLSLRPGATGLGPQSIVQRAPLATLGSGGSVFSHYLDGSNSAPGGLPPRLVGRTVIERPRTHLGFSAASEPTIDAMDWALGVLASGGVSSVSTAGQTSILFPRGLGRLYFSVSSGWAAANPQGFAVESPGGSGVSTSGQDIYCVEYDATLGWGTPFVLLSGAELGLDPEEDLDALAYDPGAGTVVYSVVHRPGSSRSQLLGYQSGANGPAPYLAAVPLRDYNDTPLMQAAGLLDVSDDVSAICLPDPEPGIDCDPFLGVRFEPTPLPVLDVGLSVERSVDANGWTTLTVQVTGGAESLDGPPLDAPVSTSLLLHHVPSGTVVVLPPQEVHQAPYPVTEWTLPLGTATGIGKLQLVALVQLSGSGVFLGASDLTTLEY